MGILADINRPKNAESCFTTRQTTAFYVNITMHLEWLLSDETGIANLGVKNRTEPSWMSTTESSGVPTTQAPPKKNGSAKINESLFILIVAIIFFSNGFNKI